MQLEFSFEETSGKEPERKVLTREVEASEPSEVQKASDLLERRERWRGLCGVGAVRGPRRR